MMITNRTTHCRLTLITQPIATLDSIIHMPSPIILGHVPKGRVNATLRGDSVRTRGKEFRDTRRLETSFRQAHGGTQTRTTGTDNDRIVRMIHDGVISNQDGALRRHGTLGYA